MCRGSTARSLSLSVVAATALVAVPGAQQTGQPEFRAGIHLVEVDVRVFDSGGQFVSDLTRDSFELLEQGVQQQLHTFYLVAGSTPAGATAGPSTGIAAAAPPAARQAWIFVFDLNHLTPAGSFDRARAAVHAFIRSRFNDGDLGGIVAGTRMVNNRLTSVREELVDAVKSVTPLADARGRQLDLAREWPRLQSGAEALQIANGDREALNRAIARACSDDPDACTRTPPDMEVREKALRLQSAIQRATMQTLTAVNALASGLAKMAGPKTIVFLSEGFVTQGLETTLRQTVGHTARAGARIYAVDVRGLNHGRGTGLIEQAMVDNEAGAPASFDPGDDGPNSLAVDTGGLMIRNENDLGRALDTIARDANQYYVLGYQPSAAFDGTFRPIEVRVKRVGVRVRARRGYLALEPSRLLVPQPAHTSAIGRSHPAPSEEETAAERTPAAEPLATRAEEPGATPGTVIAAPAAASAPARLRPDAGARVMALSGGDLAGAGEAAARGWEAYQRGDVETALPLLAQAAAQPDVRPWVLYTLGLSHTALGRPAEAAASWERLREAAPDFEPVYIDLAATYVQRADLTQALAVLRDAERRWPRDPEIHNGVGVIHVRRGALDEAIAAFTRAAQASPGDALAHFNLGRTYELRYMRGRHYVSSQRRWVAPDGDRRNAAEHYEHYLRLGGPYAPQATEALSRLGWQTTQKP